MTPRQIAFARNLLNGTTITEAARRAGYSGKNLAQSGHQALEAIRLRAPDLMDELGLSAAVLIEKHLVPQLSATTTKFLQHNGRITDSLTVPDNHARLRALEMALRLLGAYPSHSQKAGPRADEPFGVKVVVRETPLSAGLS